MCVHMKCEEIIKVFFAPLASKDKKFTASLQSQIITNYQRIYTDLYNLFIMIKVLFRNCIFFVH